MINRYVIQLDLCGGSMSLPRLLSVHSMFSLQNLLKLNFIDWDIFKVLPDGMKNEFSINCVVLSEIAHVCIWNKN